MAVTKEQWVPWGVNALKQTADGTFRDWLNWRGVFYSGFGCSALWRFRGWCRWCNGIH